MGTSKQIIVTGASSGIGRAIATQLLSEGHRVIGIARHSKTQPVVHDAFTSINIDLSDLDSLPAGLKQLATDFPDVDALVLCAGRGQFGSLEEFSFQQIRVLLELNVTSQAYLAKTFLPMFKQRGRGDLVFIGSESALQGSRKGSIYCASKFAVRGLAQALRDECSRSNVRVTLVNPGMVNSAFFDELDFAPGNDPDNYLVPQDVADAVSYVLRSRSVISIDEINLSPLKHVVQTRKKQ